MPEEISHAAAPTELPSAQGFSLVLGGPLFHFLRRTQLSDDALGLVHRRIICAALITWAPLLALSAVQGGLVGSSRAMPFLYDIGLHLRFLVAVPLLIVAELVVHVRLSPIVDQFRIRSLIRQDQAPRYANALAKAARWQRSVLAEVLLLAFVYAVGILFTLHRYVALGKGAWYASPSGGVSPAGLWLVFVSLPLFQFLLLRWYFRLFVWASFLWRMSRLDLDLNVTHPDKVGGLGFLGESLRAFVLIAVAHGVLFAGMIADHILFGGAKLTDFEPEVLGGVFFLVFAFVGPLAVFGPRLARLRRVGLAEYGAFAQSYVRAFRNKWLGGGAPSEESAIGSADIQSLADLGNTFAGAEQMRIIPIGLKSILSFIVAFLAPMLPLMLTMMSVEKLIGRLVGLVF